MNSILKLALGLLLALGLAGLEAAPSQAAERVVVVQGRHQARVVRIYHPRQQLGQPLAEPHGPVMHLAYFPRTYRGVAYVRGPHIHRRVYYHSRKYARVHVTRVARLHSVRRYVRKHAHVRTYRHVQRRWVRRPACPVVNRFGIVVAFAPGC